MIPLIITSIWFQRVVTMTDSINIYNSMAEFYASMGGILEQDVDFTIHRLEEIHSDVPF